MSAPKLSPKIEAFTEIATQQSLGISHPAIYECVFKLIEAKNLTQGHLLDYGAGQGQFVKTLREKYQHTLHAVDLMFTASKDVNWYVQDLNRPLQFKDAQFDVVTSVEVIEHLENPRRMMRELFRVLRPGGWCIVTTPNNESWRSLISYAMRGHFVDFTDSSYPAHITALNKTDLTRIFQEAGFKNIEISYTNKGTLPKFTRWTWQGVSAGYFRGRRYSDNILIAAQKSN